MKLRVLLRRIHYRGSILIAAPIMNVDDLSSAARSVPEAGFTAWSDMDRVDF